MNEYRIVAVLLIHGVMHHRDHLSKVICVCLHVHVVECSSQ